MIYLCSKCAKRSSKIAAIDSSRAVINRSLVIYLLNPFCRFLLFNNSFKLPQTWSGICEKHNRIQLSQNVPSRAWKNCVNELDSDLKIGNNRKRFFCYSNLKCKTLKSHFSSDAPCGQIQIYLIPRVSSMEAFIKIKIDAIFKIQLSVIVDICRKLSRSTQSDFNNFLRSLK